MGTEIASLLTQLQGYPSWLTKLFVNFSQLIYFLLFQFVLPACVVNSFTDNSIKKSEDLLAVARTVDEKIDTAIDAEKEMTNQQNLGANWDILKFKNNEMKRKISKIYSWIFPKKFKYCWNVFD